ncbi:hypothetical protein OKW45_007851 [Paraburkholderia sp. WSM4175]|uniref:hypothetical protein n=1 Tax=Paraburkholderia sp. WSM4175 TaxID=2991072 RepID=UPI003D259C9C
MNVKSTTATPPRSGPKRAPSKPKIDVQRFASNEPRVYSYQRFSSLKQAAGSSIERQSDYAAEWAATNGMKMDTTLPGRAWLSLPEASSRHA